MSKKVAVDHFIPISRAALLQWLNQSVAEQLDVKRYQEFCSLLQAIYHHRSHQTVERVKAWYLPFAPDADVLPETIACPNNRALCHRELVLSVTRLLRKANYRRLTRQELRESMELATPNGVKVRVDLARFQEVIVFVRGRDEETVVHRNWLKLGKKETLELGILPRLFMLIQTNPAEEKTKPGLLGRLMQSDNTGDLNAEHVHLRLFKDVPEMDLNMLFPNGTIEMRRLDKLRLSITGGGGTAAGIFLTFSKISAAATVGAIAGATLGFAGLLYRQVRNIFIHRNEYMVRWAKHLYFQNVASNTSVITRLIDMAEDEEIKEALLAYTALLLNPSLGVSAETLDHYVETQLNDEFNCNADFEVDDGLRKLQRDKLVIQDKKGHYRALPLDDALKYLHAYWDALYQYAPPKTAEEVAQ